MPHPWPRRPSFVAFPPRWPRPASPLAASPARCRPRHLSCCQLESPDSGMSRNSEPNRGCGPNLVTSPNLAMANPASPNLASPNLASPNPASASRARHSCGDRSRKPRQRADAAASRTRSPPLRRLADTRKPAALHGELDHGLCIAAAPFRAVDSAPLDVDRAFRGDGSVFGGEPIAEHRLAAEHRRPPPGRAVAGQ